MAKRNFGKKTKGKKYVFFIFLAFVLFLSAVAIFGLGTGDRVIVPGSKNIRFGIDIRGGVEAIFTPKGFDGTPTAAQMDAASRVINKRLDDLQILDREVIVGKGSDRIIVRFPWKSDEKGFNPEQALKELGEMALLTFREPDGKIAISGTDVKRAAYGIDPQTNRPVVYLELNPQGKDKFAEVTTRLSKNFAVLAIYMDEEVLSEPTVRNPILNGEAYISGNFTTESATDLAQKINAGSLPFALEATSSSTISPSLGQDSLQVMTKSGIVALALICLFMIMYYRLPGFVACLSLMTQVAGILLAISIPQQTLTLQGIAGIILSIGMGVDANVIVAERIKEELNSGKNLSKALTDGFKRAFSSVFDGNVTVAIAAIMLMIFGSGTMLSFGYSLLAGVILNGITGVWMTRMMIRSLSAYPGLQNTALYGKRPGAKLDSPGYKFTKKSRVFVIISGALIAAGIIVSAVFGINMDIDFKGGSIISYSYEGEVDIKEAGDLVGEAIGRQCRAQSTISRADNATTLVLNIAGNESMSPEQMAKVNETLNKKYPNANIRLSSSQLVDPIIGREMLTNGIKAVILASILIIAYIWFSFRTVSGGPSAGVMAMLALLHDILIVFFFVVLTRKAMNETIIAVILTILGYSINDTIVIYDRIRENIRLTGGKEPLDELVDRSITQSLGRSINTTICTFAAVTVAYVYGLLYNLNSITEFALPMMIGIISGTYSTIFFAGPLWAIWKRRGGRTGYHSGAKAVAVLLAVSISLLLVLFVPGRAVSAETTVAKTSESTVATNPVDTTGAQTEMTLEQTEPEVKEAWLTLKDVNAKSYIVYDADNGKVLAEKKSHERLSMASTTKIITAYRVLTHPEYDPKKVLTASADAVNLPSALASKAGLVAGEQITTLDCLYAMMVKSANECANVLAESYSPLKNGTPLEKREAFCKDATKFVASFGAKDTSITNPSGFAAEGLYTTASDLALITVEAMKIPTFRRLVSCSAFRMPATNKHPVAGWKRLHNTNRLVQLSPEFYGSKYYKSYDGVKTGTTSVTGYCLVGAGTTHDDRHVVAVLLNTTLKAEGLPMSIDMLMRTLLEHGAREMGVEPKNQDNGEQGVPFWPNRVWESVPVGTTTDVISTGTIANVISSAATVAETEPAAQTALATNGGSAANTANAGETEQAVLPTNNIWNRSLNSQEWIIMGVVAVALLGVVLVLGIQLQKDRRK